MGPWVSENLAVAKAQSCSSTAFNAALHKEYVALGEEALAESDHQHADIYIRKGYAACNGANVGPENPRTWWLPRRSRAELHGWYPKLLEALDYRNNRERKPAVAARAQAMYDCWVEEEHEDIWWRGKPMYQPEDIARCKNGFLAAYEELLRDTNDINFRFDRPRSVATASRDDLWPGGVEPQSGADAPSGVASLDSLISSMSAAGGSRVVLKGHTDTVGPVGYNQLLSERRASFIAAELGRGGVSPDRVRFFGVGEAELKVSTGDNVRQVQNRRVSYELR
jgi:OOP family OmpA-OmpF porin